MCIRLHRLLSQRTQPAPVASFGAPVCPWVCWPACHRPACELHQLADFSPQPSGVQVAASSGRKPHDCAQLPSCVAKPCRREAEVAEGSSHSRGA